MFNQGPMYQPFSRMLGGLPKAGFNWSGLLSNTQKVLGIVNQAIPVFYQVKPIWNNAKTMFRVMGEMSKANTNNNSHSNVANDNSTNTAASNQSNNGPNFFI